MPLPAASEVERYGLARTARRPALPPAPYLTLGLGRAGVAATRALAARAGAAAARVWDEASDASQLERARMLRREGVDVRLGGTGVGALAGVRTVVKSPGVPPDAEVMVEARRRSLTVVDELEVGWRLVPAPTVAVTGTNGKSTVSALCVAVLDEHGLEPVLCGNTDFGPPLSELSMRDPPRSIVAEVSSYQAAWSPGVAVDAAVFTNLSPDHLNWHRTMAAYGAAKRALFVGEDRAVPVAAVNADDRLGAAIARDLAHGGGRPLRYGWGADADYRIVACRWGLRDAEVEVDSPDGLVRLRTRLPGAHNAANATSVLALADGLGLPRDRTVAALENAPPVPGRFEAVDVGRPFDVVVDLAYGVGSVVPVLATARAVASRRGGRVVAVLGVVGRAAGLMARDAGRAAREGSDHLILSGTSYRGEPRLVALTELRAGARDTEGGAVETVIDRRRAIARALAVARPGDVVAILGRGHIAREATDARGGFQPLEDRAAVKELA